LGEPLRGAVGLLEAVSFKENLFTPTGQWLLKLRKKLQSNSAVSNSANS